VVLQVFPGFMLLAGNGISSLRWLKGFPEELAFKILLAITLLGVLLWLAALLGLRVLASGHDTNIVVRTVSGSIPDVRAALIRSFSLSGIGSRAARVTSLDDGGLLVEPEGQLRIMGVPCFSFARLSFSETGGAVQITAEANYGDVKRRVRKLAAYLLLASLALLIVLPLFLYYQVVPSGNPNVRLQVLQAVHVIHLLWPPWLIRSLYRKGVRSSEMFLDSACANAGVMAEAMGRKRD
jgi:hypothetical protein